MVSFLVAFIFSAYALSLVIMLITLYEVIIPAHTREYHRDKFAIYTAYTQKYLYIRWIKWDRFCSAATGQKSWFGIDQYLYSPSLQAEILDFIRAKFRAIGWMEDYTVPDPWF